MLSNKWKRQKYFNKLEKQHKQDIQTYKIKIKDWCTKYGNIERLDWIQSEIYKELEKDNELADYVFLDVDLNIHLDEKGLRLFYEILVPFFGKEEVKGVIEYLALKNKIPNLLQSLQEYMISLDDEHLKQYYKTWVESEVTEEQKQAYYITVLNMLKQEMKKRKLKV